MEHNPSRTKIAVQSLVTAICLILYQSSRIVVLRNKITVDFPLKSQQRATWTGLMLNFSVQISKHVVGLL